MEGSWAISEITCLQTLSSSEATSSASLRPSLALVYRLDAKILPEPQFETLGHLETQMDMICIASVCFLVEMGFRFLRWAKTHLKMIWDGFCVFEMGYDPSQNDLRWVWDRETHLKPISNGFEMVRNPSQKSQTHLKPISNHFEMGFNPSQKSETHLNPKKTHTSHKSCQLGL